MPTPHAASLSAPEAQAAAPGAGRAVACVPAQTLALLREPASYSPVVTQVNAVETHMSWVFLADGFAYKLKKPVAHDFLDFRTLAAREANCRAELRLNHRLAPGVYLGLTRIERDAEGKLALVDDDHLAVARRGEVTDWLVRMRRLPAERTLEYLIRHGAVTAAHVEALAGLLAGFYRHLPPADLDGEAHLRRLQAQHQLNARALARACDGVDTALTARVLDGIERAFDDERPLLAARADAGRIVEGHGDLRPEHVFMLDEPVVIDGLEFSRALRLVDWIDEIAFLGLECERLGADWLGPALRRALETALADPVPLRLFDLYGAFRACVRARLALAHLDELQPRTPERWPRLAAEYLHLAQARLARRPAQTVGN